MLLSLLPILALAGNVLVSAQDIPPCGPMAKDAGTVCPSNPASKDQQLNVDFAQIPEGTKTPPNGWRNLECKGIKNYINGKGVDLVLGEKGDCPTLITDKYYLFGKFEVEMKAAEGAGVISAITMMGDDGDEIDWEWTITDTQQVQTNYYGHGDVDGYHNGAKVDAANVFHDFHTYTIDWTSSGITYLVDGKPMRTVTAAKAGKFFPQTPMRLKVGPWSAGDSDSHWTLDWAGGKTDWSKQYTMTVRSVKITNYSPADSYSFKDASGSLNSVVAHGGEIGSPPADNSNTGPSAPSAAISAPAAPVPTTLATKASGSTTKAASATSGAVTGTITAGMRVASQIADGQVQAPTAGATTTTKVPAQQTKNAASGLTVPVVGSSSYAALVLGVLAAML